LGCVLVVGCNAHIDGRGNLGERPLGPAGGAASAGSSSLGGTASAVGPDACNAPAPAAPLRRLTRWEYNNTIADLLGDESRPADKFVAEAEQFGFDNNAAGAVLSPVVVEQFEEAARGLARQATLDLPKLLGCEPAVSGNEACASQFIASFFKRAYRRELSQAEQSRLQAFYQQASADNGFEAAIQLLVSAALQSPKFLYRLEFGMASPAAQGAVPLSSWEVASRLSYLLTGSMPDDELLAAAEKGQLDSAEQVMAQATRLLDSDRGARVVKNFYRQWAGLGDLADLQRKDPTFTSTTAGLLAEETETFADRVVRQGEGSLAALLTAPYTYLNGPLAQFYGLPAPVGDGFVQVQLDPSRYAGILTQAGLMARLAHPGQPSPVQRGKFIREKLLCAPLPPPPNNVDATLPPLDPKATAREQLTTKTSVAPCNGCHALINPLGFAFEHFDEMGRYRVDDHGLPIDASGALTATDVDGPFQDQIGLMKLLSGSEQVRSCVVTNWFRYAYGREASEGDGCSKQQLSQVFNQSGGNIKQLLLSLTQTPAFRFRDATAPGATP
jgi:hypothetical protein